MRGCGQGVVCGCGKKGWGICMDITQKGKGGEEVHAHNTV